MKSLRHIWFIALKDMKVFVTDRMALFFFVLFPFLFVILFNFLLAGVDQQDDRMELHLVTRESSRGLSRLIIDDLVTKDESELEPGEPRFVWDKNFDTALQKVEDRKIDGFVLFPDDFTDGIQMGYGARIQVVVNPEATNIRPALNAVADAIGSSFGLQQVAKNAVTGLTIEETIASPADTTSTQQYNKLISSVLGGVGVKSPDITFEVQKIGEVEVGNPSNYVIPGYLVMFVFMAAATAAESIVTERQNHTLERLLASSVRRESILGGMFAGTVVKGLVQIIIFWGVGILAFKIDMGISPLAVIVLSFLMVLMSAAFSVMLATLARSQRSAASMAILTSLTLAPLG